MLVTMNVCQSPANSGAGLRTVPSGVSMVITAKDERRLLRDNLLFHRYLGVDHFFLYDDGSCDGALASVADLPFTTIKPSVDRTLYANDPSCRDLIERYDFIYVARQLLNVRNALDQTRARGDSWLISIDADELVCPDPDRLERGMLADKLAAMGPEIDQVVFPIAEVVQDRPTFVDVFAEAKNFKIERNEKLTRDCFDPAKSKPFAISHIYGHRMGKSAVRVRPETIPEEHTHRFGSRTGASLNSARCGYLLHYFRFDSRHFIDSLRQIPDHPNQWQPGGGIGVERQKRVWRDLVNHQSRSDMELREYYERWIMIPEDEIRDWFELEPPGAKAIPAVSQLFRELRAESFQAGCWIPPTVTPVPSPNRRNDSMETKANWAGRGVSA